VQRLLARLLNATRVQSNEEICSRMPDPVIQIKGFDRDTTRFLAVDMRYLGRSSWLLFEAGDV
jgi:hypothetical protein